MVWGLSTVLLHADMAAHVTPQWPSTPPPHTHTPLLTDLGQSLAFIKTLQELTKE